MSRGSSLGGTNFNMRVLKFLRAAMLNKTNRIDSSGIAYNNRSKTHDYATPIGVEHLLGKPQYKYM